MIIYCRQIQLAVWRLYFCTHIADMCFGMHSEGPGTDALLSARSCCGKTPSAADGTSIKREACALCACCSKHLLQNCGNYKISVGEEFIKEYCERGSRVAAYWPFCP